MNKKIQSLLWEAKHHEKKNWLLSEQILEKVITLNPQTFEAHELLYRIYMHHSLYRKAEKALKRALVYFPNKEYLFFLMGNIFLAQSNKSHLAIKWYKKVKLKLPELKFNLAVAYVYQKKRRAAIRIFKEALPYFKNIVTSYTFLAEQYLKITEYDNAIKILKSALKYFPTNKNIYYLLGIAYNKKHNWIQAFLYFEKANDLNYSSSEFYNRMAGCCYQMGEIEKSIRYYKKSISKNFLYIKSYLDLSKLYIQEGKYQQAKRYLIMARKLDPLNVYVTLASEKLKNIFKDIKDKDNDKI